MQLNDQVTLGDWIPKRWPNDKGLADKKIAVNTALGSGYAHARRAAETSEELLDRVAKLQAAVDKLTNLLTKE